MRKTKTLNLEQREARLAYWFVVPTFVIVFWFSNISCAL